MVVSQIAVGLILNHCDHVKGAFEQGTDLAVAPDSASHQSVKWGDSVKAL